MALGIVKMAEELVFVQNVHFIPKVSLVPRQALPLRRHQSNGKAVARVAT